MTTASVGVFLRTNIRIVSHIVFGILLFRLPLERHVGSRHLNDIIDQIKDGCHLKPEVGTISGSTRPI